MDRAPGGAKSEARSTSPPKQRKLERGTPLSGGGIGWTALARPRIDSFGMGAFFCGVKPLSSESAVHYRKTHLRRRRACPHSCQWRRTAWEDRLRALCITRRSGGSHGGGGAQGIYARSAGGGAEAFDGAHYAALPVLWSVRRLPLSAFRLHGAAGRQAADSAGDDSARGQGEPAADRGALGRSLWLPQPDADED